jgi:hypothetical protein
LNLVLIFLHEAYTEFHDAAQHFEFVPYYPDKANSFQKLLGQLALPDRDNRCSVVSKIGGFTIARKLSITREESILSSLDLTLFVVRPMATPMLL